MTSTTLLSGKGQQQVMSSTPGQSHMMAKPVWSVQCGMSMLVLMRVIRPPIVVKGLNSIFYRSIEMGYLNNNHNQMS